MPNNYYPLSVRLQLQCEDNNLAACGYGYCTREEFDAAIDACKDVKADPAAERRWKMKWLGLINPFVGEP